MSQNSPRESGTDKRETDNQEEQRPFQGEEGAKPESAPRVIYRTCLFREVTTKLWVCVLACVLIGSIILALGVHLAMVASRGCKPSCPDSWVGHQRKCYYFSNTEENWDSSRSQCLALGASLTGIDSLQELTFLTRHKGPNSHWIGLRREEEAQPWKWANGTEFNNLFPVTEGADCAYMNSKQVSSSSCLTLKKWICSQPMVASRGSKPSCPDGWVGHQRKCYYFSDTEGNWDSSQSQCLALGASLTGIDSLQELTFLTRHKGPNSHWIGLRREEEAQPWKWANGTEFNNLFPVTEGANCAYMNSKQVSSSSCLTLKKWICSQPSVH